MRVLALECSSATGSAALVEVETGAVLGLEEFDASARLAVELPKAAARLLAAAGPAFAPERIVAGIGPGNYTGLRIAAATAQGLALAQGIPVVGTPSWRGLRREGGADWLIGNAGRGKAFRLRLDAPDASAIDLLDGPSLTEWLAEMAPGAVLRLNALPGAENLEERHPEAARLACAEPLVGVGSPVEPIYLQAACAAPANWEGEG